LDESFCNSSGGFAKFAAIRRASSMFQPIFMKGRLDQEVLFGARSARAISAKVKATRTKIFIMVSSTRIGIGMEE